MRLLPVNNTSQQFKYIDFEKRAVLGRNIIQIKKC